MALNGRKEALTLVGPSILLDLLNRWYQAADGGLTFPVHMISTDEVHEETRLLETPYFSIYGFPLQHRTKTTGYSIVEAAQERKLRIDSLPEDLPYSAYKPLKRGEDVVYQGRTYRSEVHTSPAAAPRKYSFFSDTRKLINYPPIAYGSDLLYHEATFRQQHLARAERTLHSTALEAAMTAADLQVGKLLLGHFSARYTDLEPLLEEAKCHFAHSYLVVEGQPVPVRAPLASHTDLPR